MFYDGIVIDLKAGGFTKQCRDVYHYHNPRTDHFAAIGTIEHDRWAVYIWKRGEEGENYYNYDSLQEKLSSIQ